MKVIHFIIAWLFMSCTTVKIDRDPKDIKAPFNGKKFDNLEPFPDKSFFSLLKWKFGGKGKNVPWPKSVDNPVFKPSVLKSSELIITIINHATVLIQMNDLNILTDPHFTQRASPVSFAGPKRVIKPGINFKDLPPIDIVLISHNHYDHLDLKTLEMLKKRDNPQIYAGLGTKYFLNENKLDKSFDLDWWESFKVKDVEITFVPAQHWSARGLNDKREMLWGGFFIKGNQSVYFAGDTGYGKFFKLINEKLGSPDLSLLPIGAFEPRWFMKSAHMNPTDAVMAFKDLQTTRAVGIHFGTFKLTDEGIDDPKKELVKALEIHKVDDNLFTIPVFGKAYFFN